MWRNQCKRYAITSVCTLEKFRQNYRTSILFPKIDQNAKTSAILMRRSKVFFSAAYTTTQKWQWKYHDYFHGIFMVKCHELYHENSWLDPWKFNPWKQPKSFHCHDLSDEKKISFQWKKNKSYPSWPWKHHEISQFHGHDLKIAGS